MRDQDRPDCCKLTYSARVPRPGLSRRPLVKSALRPAGKQAPTYSWRWTKCGAGVPPAGFGGVLPPEAEELPGETPGQLAGEDACATLSTAVASPRRGALRTAGLWFAAVREDKGIGTATRRMRFSNLFKNVRFAASGDAVCSESGHCALSIALPRQRPITHAAVARKRPPHLPASDRKECGRRAPRRWIWQWPIPGLFHCFCRRSRTARTNCL